jgi:hypothetical protein
MPTRMRAAFSRPPSQGWWTFLHNHAPDMAAMGLLVVPTISFDLLYAFVMLRLDRRDLVWINVTANPTAEWVAHQITEAFPWDEALHDLISGLDRIYGSVVTRRLRAIGIRDKPTAIPFARSYRLAQLCSDDGPPFRDRVAPPFMKSVNFLGQLVVRMPVTYLHLRHSVSSQFSQTAGNV